MQKGENEIGRLIFLLLLFFTGPIAISQVTTDSVTKVTSGTISHNTTPLLRSGKPFYDILLPFREGLHPMVLFSSDDRFFAGITCNNFSRNWRPDSAGQKHKTFLHYSFIQKAFSIGYQGVFNDVVAGWNLYAEANYDWIRWTNFYGLGNETKQLSNDGDFHRIRSREAFVGLSFQHLLGKQSSITLTPFYQRIGLLNDTGRFFSSSFIAAKTPAIFGKKNFGGLRADLLLRRVDDLLLPTKGTITSVSVAHVKNLAESKSFTNYGAAFRFYVPFLKHFVFSMENGAATVRGEPEFYQLNSIGGATLRGYRRERFWGQTTFRNNNELYYLFNAPWEAFRGKMGVMVFGDAGRVWLDGEQSNKWHYGYGSGLVLVPYNKVYLAAQYGISNERRGFHFILRRTL